ncbi:PAS domain S-box protein [Marinicellulosiphila megalodicopiae]|uniref:PAS domain S-box protein n=1 Tax=Marinicellulosiphila megalodicopiae TaxID=2724896 RepID=UPI003BB04C6A
MVDTLSLFFNDQYMPHGHCFIWYPGILWTTVVADLLVALAYFSIPVCLMVLVHNDTLKKFKTLFVLFSAFILLCGLTHVIAVYNIWNGAYGIQAVVKMITAIVSIATAIVLLKIVPQLKNIPSPSQLAEALEQVHTEQLKNQAGEIFKFSTELLPTGVLIIDENQCIQVVNKKVENTFGYEKDELIGQPLSILLHTHLRALHSTIVSEFVFNETKQHSMAQGRIVTGRCKDGSSVSLEIMLNTHMFLDQKMTFASINNVDESTSESRLYFESTNRIKRAINATNDGIWEWNFVTGSFWHNDQLVNILNPACLKISHFNEFISFVHREDKERIKAAINSSILDHRSFELIFRVSGPQNNYLWIKMRGEAMYNADQPVLMSGLITNIHEQIILENALIEKTNFIEKIHDNSLSGLYIFDLIVKTNTFINKEYTRITGYTLSDLAKIQKRDGDLMALFHPDDIDRMLKHFDDVYENQQSTIDYRFKHKDGHWFWCSSRDALYEIKDGLPTLMLGTFFDITELKIKEERYKSLYLEFNTTYDLAAIGIINMDKSGEFIRVNKYFYDMLGYDKKLIDGKSIVDLIHDVDLDYCKNEFKELLNKNKVESVFEKRLIKKDGTAIWCNFNISTVKESDGYIKYFIAVIENITDKRSAQEQIQQSNVALERFAFNASHDLQEPLRKINLFGESLSNRLVGKLDDPDARYELDRILNATTRMSEMVKGLLQLSRFGREKFIFEPILLSEILESIKEDLSNLINETGAQIELISDVNLEVNKIGFMHVLINLIVNAIHYRKPEQKAEIKICGKLKEDAIEIEVIDQGVGFSNEYAEQIFEPFRSLVSRHKSGSGLGLSICKTIIEKHQGLISARFDENVGTIILIKLPR